MIKLKFIKSLPKLYRNWKYHQENDDRLNAYEQDFIRGKFNKGMQGNPFTDVGVAVLLIDKYKLSLHEGLSYGDMRVMLDKKDWQFPIKNNNINGIGLFVKTPIEKIDCIVALGSSLNYAVCMCLIYSRNAGVI